MHRGLAAGVREEYFAGAALSLPVAPAIIGPGVHGPVAAIIALASIAASSEDEIR